jgi:Tfp pilus assembly protein PilF
MVMAGKAVQSTSVSEDSLGEAYMKAGNMKLAEESYQKSLKLDPKNQNAENMLKKIRDSARTTKH